MLKLFRKIRQNLALEGNLKRYLLYAIGEIFLVVVGILLALQINTWNENRKDRAAETKILFDLKQEFIMNKTKLDAVFQVKQNSLNRTRKFIELLTSPEISSTDFIDARKNNLGIWTYNPSNGVINTLISTGRIDLIINDSLKYLLTNWKDELLDYQEEEINHLNWFNSNWEPFINATIPRKYEGNGKPEYLYHDKNQLTALFNLAINNTNFQNLAIRNERHLYRAVSEGEELIKSLQNILDMLESESAKNRN